VGVKLSCTEGRTAGEVIQIEAELVIGREAPEPGRLGGDPRLSRRHARVFIDSGGRPLAEDLGSTNGTWVNDERLTEIRRLADGDRLRVGQSTFTVGIEDPPALTQVDEPTAASPTITAVAGSGPRLLVLAGPTQGEEIPLRDELLIGRSYDEPGSLGGDRKLSRRHARIALGPSGVFLLEDTGSTNGTLLNHVRLRRAHSLKDGDEIEVGSTRLQTHGLPRAPLADNVEEEEERTAIRDAEPGLAAPAPAAPRAAGPAPPLGATPLGPGHPFSAGQPAQPLFQPQGAAGARLSRRRLVTAFAAVFAAAVVVAVGAVVLAAPLGTRGCAQGFICHKPSTAPPLRALTTFTGSLGWRVEYDSQMATPAVANANGNDLVLHESRAWDSDNGAPAGSQIITVFVRAFRAAQTSRQAAGQSLLSSLTSNLVGAATAPSSDQLFPNPVLGFHPGIGAVVEGNVRTPQGPGGLEKVAVLSAESGGLTIAAAVVYPVQQGQQQQSDPDTPLDQFGDQVLETVRFPSDGAA